MTGRLDLGVGLALMPGLVDDLDRVEGLVDCLEVEPQTFWWETGDPDEPFRLQADEVLALARRVDAVLAHGVSSPVGGSRPPHPHLARLFRETAHLLGARLASEHLAFNHAGPEDGEYTTAFFLPPRQTPAGVEVAAASIAALRHGLEVPFSVETPVNYLRTRPDEMDDGAYVAAVAERADCGILLDLHNIWANERNGRQDARAYVAQLPLDRVWEVHLAGGFDRGGYWLDAHSGTLHPDLLALAADVLPRLPQVRAVVYEVMPEFVERDGRDQLRPDLEAVHRLVDSLPRGTTRAPNEPQPPSETAPDPDADTVEPAGPAAWEDALAGLAIGRDAAPGDALAGALAADPAVGLLRDLVGAGRSGRVVSSLPLTLRLLVTTDGVAGVDALLTAYAAATEPALWGSDEGRRFAGWLTEQAADRPLVLAALALDRAALDSVRAGRPQPTEVAVDPLALVDAIHHDRDPGDLPTGRYLVTVGGP